MSNTPTDAEIWQMWMPMTRMGVDDPVEFARAVLAKWGTPQVAGEPCPACIALARTVMLDQVSFDRKPDCYGIRQITDDEGIEEWEDIRTSPDVAREEANDMMATGRGEIYEVVPLWTTPQPTQAADSVLEDAMAWPKPGPQNPTWTICPKFLEKIMRSSASEYMPGLEEIEAVLLGLRTLFSASRVDLPGWESWPPDAQAQAGAVPLTDEQIQEAILPINPHGMGYFLRIARAIERAHGIKGGQHG